jgi:chromosome segregation ATPase
MSDEYSDDAVEFDGIEESIASASDLYYAEDDFEQDAASPDHSQTAPAVALLNDALHLSQETNAKPFQQQQQPACTAAAVVPVQQPARLAAVQQQFEQAKAELQSAATARLTAALAKRKRADARRLQHIQELTEAKQAAAAAQADTAALNAELSVTRVQLQRQTAQLATQAQELDETLRLSEKQHDETVSLKRTVRDLQAACAAATSEIDAANSQVAQLQNEKVGVK